MSLLGGFENNFQGHSQPPDTDLFGVCKIIQRGFASFLEHTSVLSLIFAMCLPPTGKSSTAGTQRFTLPDKGGGELIFLEKMLVAWVYRARLNAVFRRYKLKLTFIGP